MKGVMLECHRETVVVAVPGTMREWPMDLAVVKMGRWANTVMVRTVLAKTVPTLGKRATTLVARVTLVGQGLVLNQMMARCQVKVHTREELPDQRALTLVARVTPWAKTAPVMVKLVLLLAHPALRVVTAPAKVAKA